MLRSRVPMNIVNMDQAVPSLKAVTVTWYNALNTFHTSVIRL